MKKLILLALALAAVMMAGCIEANSKLHNEKRMLNLYGGTYYTPNGCEYYNYNNYHGGFPIHKEDCKKCAEHRKQELKELVKELKGE